MDKHFVTTEQMQALKALSDVNIKISEAHNLLQKLQEQETEYLVIRETKALDRIQKTIDDSASLIKIADENYGQIKTFTRSIGSFIDHLTKLTDEYNQLIAEFEARNTKWEQGIGKQQDEIDWQIRHLKVQQVTIENDRKSLELERSKLVEAQKKLHSDRGTLDRAIKRLKEGKI